MLKLSGFLEKGEEAHSHKETLRNISSVSVDPILNVRVFIVEQVGLHLLGGLGLGLEGVGRDTGADTC